MQILNVILNVLFSVPSKANVKQVTLEWGNTIIDSKSIEH